MGEYTDSGGLMHLFDLHHGTAPLLISMPHSGTFVPADIASRLSAAGRALSDTDWHVPRLYDFARAIGATVLRANYSRYVIDLNRPPDDTSLYPGQATTGLCPDTTFAGEPLYAPGDAPSLAEIHARRTRFWQPYHDALADALAQLQKRHGSVLLYDAHSIASRVPRLFEGRLSDLNLGTAHGTTCAPILQDTAAEVLQRSPYSCVINGRFVGGFITRHYGNPKANAHAMQMEIAQDTYMHETVDRAWRDEQGAALAATLRALLEALTRTVQRLGQCDQPAG